MLPPIAPPTGCAVLCRPLGTSAFCCLQPREPSQEPLVTSLEMQRGSFLPCGCPRQLELGWAPCSPAGSRCRLGGCMTRPSGSGHANTLLLPAVHGAALGGPIPLSRSSAASLCFRDHSCPQNDVFVLQPIVYLNLCHGQLTPRSVDICFPKIGHTLSKNCTKEGAPLVAGIHIMSPIRSGLRGAGGTVLLGAVTEKGSVAHFACYGGISVYPFPRVSHVGGSFPQPPAPGPHLLP